MHHTAPANNAPAIRPPAAYQVGMLRQQSIWATAQPDPPTGPTTIPTTSPWGTVQAHRVAAPGITEVSTAGHGGIHLDRWRQQRMPPALRGLSVWYEEDCEWCLPVVTFVAEFSQTQVGHAMDTLREWFPDRYERFTGEVIPPGGSSIKDEEVRLLRHERELFARCVWSAGQAVIAGREVVVPAGQVLVETVRGYDADAHPRHHYPPGTPRPSWYPLASAPPAPCEPAAPHGPAYALVDRQRYTAPRPGTYMVDPRCDRLVGLQDLAG